MCDRCVSCAKQPNRWARVWAFIREAFTPLPDEDWFNKP